MNRFEKIDSLNQKIVFETLNRGTVVVIKRCNTARESLKLFFEIVQEMKTSEHAGLFMPSVGLKCDSRSSAYDILFDIQKRILYTIDTKDPNYVCKATPVAYKTY